MKKLFLLFLFITACTHNIFTSDPTLTATPDTKTDDHFLEVAIPKPIAESFCNYLDDGTMPQPFIDPQTGPLGLTLRLILPYGKISPCPIFSTQIEESTVQVYKRTNTSSSQTWHEFRFGNPHSRNLAKFYCLCRVALSHETTDEMPTATE